MLAPLRDELERYDQRLTSFDRERAIQFGALSEQLHSVAAASEGLRDQTHQLASALRTPSVRGRWGEVQLAEWWSWPGWRSIATSRRR